MKRIYAICYVGLIIVACVASQEASQEAQQEEDHTILSEEDNEVVADSSAESVATEADGFKTTIGAVTISDPVPEDNLPIPTEEAIPGTPPEAFEDNTQIVDDLEEESVMGETTVRAVTIPDSASEDNVPLPTEETISENPPAFPTEPCEASSPEPPSEFPSITISLPTLFPSTFLTTNSIDIARSPEGNLCKENETYSCLPFCTKTCSNPMSKFLCRPVSNHFRLCRRGCTCKSGYMLEKPNGKCVSECSRRFK